MRAALAASDSLIVLCSPHAAASPWVAREIEAFRELNPGRPVLAAIVDGEPADCFPSALSSAGAEPLAADLRRSGDGQRLGFLKLVAGLTGVGLDALVQRDAARQIRRVTAVTLVAIAATLVMAVLTVVALSAPPRGGASARRSGEIGGFHASRFAKEAEGGRQAGCHDPHQSGGARLL
ncbi:MAG: TIR domain-containing protein [Sphingomonas sp.]